MHFALQTKPIAILAKNICIGAARRKLEEIQKAQFTEKNERTVTRLFY